MLILFLVDPHLRIVSSASLPPEEWEWNREKTDLVDRILSQRLPIELRDMVRDLPRRFMTLQEARKYRLELMEEPSVGEELAVRRSAEGRPPFENIWQ